MDSWNEWSWLAIPTTAWAVAWWLRGLAGCVPEPRRGSPWWSPTRWEIRKKADPEKEMPDGKDIS